VQVQEPVHIAKQLAILLSDLNELLMSGGQSAATQSSALLDVIASVLDVFAHLAEDSLLVRCCSRCLRCEYGQLRNRCNTCRFVATSAPWAEAVQNRRAHSALDLNCDCRMAHTVS
jgi:hypothetical protein